MIPLCLVPFPLHVCRAQQDIDFFQSEPRHGQHHSQSFSAQEKVASGKCSTCLPSLPLPSSPPTHTCLQALTSWVTAGNSHPPAGPVLFLRKENSWVILKMEVKIHLTSQLQLSGPRKQHLRTGVVDVTWKLRAADALSAPSRRDCILHRAAPKDFCWVALVSFFSFIKCIHWRLVFWGFWLREERPVSKLAN